MELQKTLGSKIRELRQNKHLSQQAFANELHVTHQTISAWETGKSSPDIDTLHRICDFFDITLDELCEEKQKEQALLIGLELEEHRRHRQHILSIVEQVALMVTSIVLSLIPFIGVLAPMGIIIWMLYKKKRYYFIYIICIIALLIGFQNTYVTMGQLLDIGHATIEKIN